MVAAGLMQSGQIYDSTGFAVGAKIAGTIYGKNFRKPGSSAVHPALDGADGTSANLRGFFIRKSGCADQDKRLALVWGKQLERFAEFA